MAADQVRKNTARGILRWSSPSPAEESGYRLDPRAHPCSNRPRLHAFYPAHRVARAFAQLAARPEARGGQGGEISGLGRSCRQCKREKQGSLSNNSTPPCRGCDFTWLTCSLCLPGGHEWFHLIFETDRSENIKKQVSAPIHGSHLLTCWFFVGFFSFLRTQ